MIDGLTSAQQRAIQKMRLKGRTLDSIADEWNITIDTVKAVLAHRDSLDENKGVIRLGITDDL